jgi:hypothetical protein
LHASIIALLFKIVKKRKQSQIPLLEEYIGNSWCIHVIILFSHRKKEIFPTCLNDKEIILSAKEQILHDNTHKGI